MARAAAATGTLRKKIQRQPTVSVRNPPAVGPRTAERANIVGTTVRSSANRSTINATAMVVATTFPDIIIPSGLRSDAVRTPHGTRREAGDRYGRSAAKDLRHTRKDRRSRASLAASLAGGAR